MLQNSSVVNKCTICLATAICIAIVTVVNEVPFLHRSLPTRPTNFGHFCHTSFFNSWVFGIMRQRGGGGVFYNVTLRKTTPARTRLCFQPRRLSIVNAQTKDCKPRTKQTMVVQKIVTNLGVFLFDRCSLVTEVPEKRKHFVIWNHECTF